MVDLALIMLAVLAGLCLIVIVSMRGGWRIAGRMAVLGIAVICVHLAVIRLAPTVGDWLAGVLT
ncbi:hypothetical protein [Streptomyces sp. TE5632]